MNTRAAFVLVALMVLAVIWGSLPPPSDLSNRVSAQPAKSDSAQDREALVKNARDFEKAFAAGDAKAIAAFWTDNGELEDADGELIRGRADIDKAYAEFFKANPKTQIEILIGSIRFPSVNVAIEEGLLRQSSVGKRLPTTTQYAVVHSREKDGWKMASSREWGAEQHRLAELEWLIGTWKAKVKDDDVTLTLAKDAKKPHLTGEFVRKSKDKVVTSGIWHIGIDPQKGQLRSWHFDDAGGHGQSLWLRDGDKWVLDYVGVDGDGVPHEAVNLIGRINNNEITWRSIDRVSGDRQFPDLPPVKLVREQQGRAPR